MVHKIRKKSKKGPKAPYAVPMVWVQTCLYGIRREGRGFHEGIKDPQAVRGILHEHFEKEVVIGDRPLTRKEYTGWNLRKEPGPLAEMFGAPGLIPMGPADPFGEEEKNPQLGLLPIVVLVKGKDVEPFLSKDWSEFSEIRRVGLERLLYPSFHLIPGYDLFLSPGPFHGRRINPALEALNALVQFEFERSGLPPAEPFPMFPADDAQKIPLSQPYKPVK